ncbi:MAG: DUF3857 domain-containing protein [Flavobacteriaceae bacterium]|nr:DUF3857 domain-containing protein [Flavobacteriaceae bacterium]
MKPNLLLLIFGVLLFNVSYAQKSELSVASIPENLKENANSVVRFDDTRIAIGSSKSMTVTIKKAITILDKLGDEEAVLIVYYDKTTRIKKLKAYAYDASGNEIKDIPKKDFLDISAVDGNSLFIDSRRKAYKYTPVSYPYTFYYEYEVETSNTAFIPSWEAIDSYNQSVEESSFEITFPAGMHIKKIEKNFEGYPILKKEDTNLRIAYEATMISAIEEEDYSPSEALIFPSLILGAGQFHLEGVDGKAETWNEYGKWIYNNLLEGRNDLPEATKNRIRNLVKGVEDPVEKARIVYNYVQDKTRYISVQVGIGGWMPMLASEVDNLSYGDCKALTNYTKALMDAAGVQSYYTVVSAGQEKESILKDLVSLQGNHVFLDIPTATGDVWLECTSQSVPFGYQGTFTDDRDVLVITPEGGIIKHTGTYKFNDNLQVTKAQYKLTPNGSLTGEVTITSRGIQYENHYILESMSKEDIEKYYKKYYWPYINNISLEKYSFHNDKDSIAFTEKIDLKATDYSIFTSGKMLFNINAFNRVNSTPKRYRNRKLPLDLKRSFKDVDIYDIRLPEGYSLSEIPENISIKNKFGEYHVSLEKTGNNMLRYTRTLIIEKGNFPSTEYDNYRNFRKEINKYDKLKIILNKNQNE